MAFRGVVVGFTAVLLRRSQVCMDENWPKKRTAEAKANHLTITDAVSTRMEKLLAGQLSDRRLTASELKAVSMELLRAMVPLRSNPEAKQ